MNYDAITIVKRDGKTESFSIEKIKKAIAKAYSAAGIRDENGVIDTISERVADAIRSEQISVEEIQDMVERELMVANQFVAKKYIIYRQWRNTEREKRTSLKTIMDGIVAIEKNDVNLSNANMK